MPLTLLYFFILGGEKMDNNENGFIINTSFAEELPEEPPQNNQTFAGEFLEWIEVLCSAMVMVVVLFTFIFRVATIEGESMLYTLEENDKVVISNLNYEPRQGDIVVVSRNAENTIKAETTSNEPIIKRVIAVGGQTVDIDFKTGTVYVDGKVLEEDYLGSPTYDKYDVDFPIYIPEGYIFIMGDNRGNSMDSRDGRIGEGGLVDERYVLGRAIYRFMPFNKIGKLK